MGILEEVTLDMKDGMVVLDMEKKKTGRGK